MRFFVEPQCHGGILSLNFLFAFAVTFELRTGCFGIDSSHPDDEFFLKLLQPCCEDLAFHGAIVRLHEMFFEIED